MDTSLPFPALTTLRAARALVVADDPLARAGLALLLEDATAGQTAGGGDLAAAVREHQPDAVVWDLGADPRRVADRLGEFDGTALPVLALLPDEGYAADALAAGARALLPRDAPAAQLRAALQAVALGLLVFDPALAVAVLPRAPTGGPADGRSDRESAGEDLTARESEVLQLLAEALPNKSIAARLGISDHTVKFHVNAILAKLGAQSRTEAVVRAARLGLVIL